MAVFDRLGAAWRVLNGRASAVDLRKYGRREADLLRALANNTNAKDSALHHLLNCFRLLHWLARSNGQTVAGKDVLEIGTSKRPGLPLALLASGSRSVAANNVFALDDFLDEDYVRVLELLVCGLLPVDPSQVERLLRWETRSHGRVAVLDPERFLDWSSVPAEAIDAPSESLDAVFSFSVLEHVERPRDVLEKSFELLRPGGWCYHTIDLRDHSDFTRPIDFLRWGEAEYRERTGAPENRLRASDFLELFEAVGFEARTLRFLDRIPDLAEPGKTDVASTLQEPFERTWEKADFDHVEPWVDEAFRAGLDAVFAKKSLADLSVLGLAVAYRKPLASYSNQISIV